jgi:hypothetical protein
MPTYKVINAITDEFPPRSITVALIHKANPGTTIKTGVSKVSQQEPIQMVHANNTSIRTGEFRELANVTSDVSCQHYNYKRGVQRVVRRFVPTLQLLEEGV